ncbi:MAG: bacteriohopanetetrol glucosamine biosynthesis glycosyltransferase HpnI [Armatimonadota bacterium]|nr:bacteriohopanetetrol glucosamine biosynthesis glycosyltransferase HpnI [bacterium]
MTQLEVALLVLASAGTAYYIFSTLALIAHFNRYEPEGTSYPKVSVLKPVRGIDANARENFITFLEQDYPDYEVLFGILNHDDPVEPLVREVIEGIGHASLHIGSSILGTNNKVRILHNLVSRANGEILVITDADTRAEPDFLMRIVAPFEDDGVGMVTCMYRGVGGMSISDALEGLHMTCLFAPGVACANALKGIDFGLGATIAIRRETLELIGGFEPIRHYLADDFQIGRRAAMIGHEVKLSDYVMDIVLSGESLINILARELRWSVTQRVSRPFGQLGLAMTYGLAYATAFCIVTDFSLLGWSVLGCVVVVRTITAAAGARSMGDHQVFKRLWLLPARDLLSFIIWVMGWFSRTVKWRGRKLRLTPDGRIIRVK